MINNGWQKKDNLADVKGLPNAWLCFQEPKAVENLIWHVDQHLPYALYENASIPLGRVTKNICSEGTLKFEKKKVRHLSSFWISAHFQ